MFFKFLDRSGDKFAKIRREEAKIRDLMAPKLTKEQSKTKSSITVTKMSTPNQSFDIFSSTTGFIKGSPCNSIRLEAGPLTPPTPQQTSRSTIRLLPQDDGFSAE